MEILNTIKEQFINLLVQHLSTYVLIGTTDIESPMWYQYAGEEDGHLLFRSSQKNIGFRIPTPDGFNTHEEDWKEIYNYFKKIKYEYIRDSWPTVFDEIKGTQKVLINDFLKTN
jgi:hypothetical protein